MNTWTLVIGLMLLAVTIDATNLSKHRALRGDDDYDDDDLLRFVAIYKDGTREEFQATDIDEAWSWAEALSGGRKVKDVRVDE